MQKAPTLTTGVIHEKSLRWSQGIGQIAEVWNVLLGYPYTLLNSNPFDPNASGYLPGYHHLFCSQAHDEFVCPSV